MREPSRGFEVKGCSQLEEYAAIKFALLEEMHEVLMEKCLDATHAALNTISGMEPGGEV